jgi:hypothetical protein
MSNESQTASNTPSDTVLCKMGCGFFVSRHTIRVRTVVCAHDGGVSRGSLFSARRDVRRDPPRRVVRVLRMEDAPGLVVEAWDGEGLAGVPCAVDTASVLRSASFSDRHPGSFRARIFSLHDNNTAIRTNNAAAVWRVLRILESRVGGRKQGNEPTNERDKDDSKRYGYMDIWTCLSHLCMLSCDFY